MLFYYKNELTDHKSTEEKCGQYRLINCCKFALAISKFDSISKNSVHIGDTNITVGELYRDTLIELISRWS